MITKYSDVLKYRHDMFFQILTYHTLLMSSYIITLYLNKSSHCIRIYHHTEHRDVRRNFRVLATCVLSRYTNARIIGLFEKIAGLLQNIVSFIGLFDVIAVYLQHAWRGGGLGSRPIFKKFHETYAPS